MISMRGDGDKNGPGEFLLLDEDFNIAGRWENKADGMAYNYDFWYQPRRTSLDLPGRARRRRAGVTAGRPAG